MVCVITLALFPALVALFATVAYRALRFVASLQTPGAR